MTGRLLRPALLALALAAAPAAWAQAPPAATAPLPGADFLRSGGDPEPDTTAPWRYFPLHVGDAWEYYNYFTGERRRADVYGTETHGGRLYFSTVNVFYDDGGDVVYEGEGDVVYDGGGEARTGTWAASPSANPGRALRYDTTAAAVWYYVEQTGGEFPLSEASCPLGADFGVEVACYLESGPFAVEGTYEGLLAFGEPFPGTGEDTVRTAVKRYVYDTNPGIYYDLRYAAGIGLIYYDDEYVREGIYYARVDGVEYGVSVLPPFVVSAEGGAPEAGAPPALEVWPNPFESHLSVAMSTPEGGSVTVEVVDVLGRLTSTLRSGSADGRRSTLSYLP